MLSLCDMIQFPLVQFVKDWESFLFTASVYKDAASKQPNTAIIGEARAHITFIVKHLHFHSKALHHEKSTDRLWRLGLRLENKNIITSFIHTEFEEVQALFETELNESCLAIIPKGKAIYFEKDGDDALFGSGVSEAFPEAWDDIKAAGNCIAAGLYDGAIFYLMRVAETGMRALAKHLRAKVEKRQWAKKEENCPKCKFVIHAAVPAKAKRLPLDYAMWEEVIKALEYKIEAVQNSPKGKKRTIQYEFYHGLIIELNAFKDLWRNEVSHCRRKFGELEAMQIYPHVKYFMQRLAIVLSKKKSTDKKSFQKLLGTTSFNAKKFSEMFGMIGDFSNLKGKIKPPENT